MVVVFTGDGKGKTSAAVGTALRAWGQGKRVLIINFLKAPNISGEYKAFTRLNPDGIKILAFGRSCPYQNQDCCPGKHECIVTKANKTDADKALILDGLTKYSTESASGIWDVIILDELLNVYNLFPDLQSLIMDNLENNPPTIDLVVTGRVCPEDIINLADYVTDMKMVRHPFLSGTRAKKGLDY